MKGMDSLIRISNFEVEDLQKRLSEIVGRRTEAEMRLAVLEAHVEVEVARARADAEAAMFLGGFREGAKHRRAVIEHELRSVGLEEEGARDALALAFESLKKYETVKENHAVAARKEAARLETLAFDEIGLRRAWS